jgi:5'-3' exonuclease
MGVPQLLQYTLAAQKRVRLGVSCRGKSVAVDSSCWLHELAASLEHVRRFVVLNDPSSVVKAFVDRAGYWRMKGVTLVFVFDGKDAAAKAATNEARRPLRINTREQLNKEGVSVKEWRQKMASAVSTDWNIVSKVINGLREAGFVYMVAPFEAHGQLTYVCKEGIVDAVWTADTDLIVLGCPQTYLRIEYYHGTAILVTQEALAAEPAGKWSGVCVGDAGRGVVWISPADSLRPFPLAGGDDEDSDLLKLARQHGVLPTLRLLAALAGCDYKACHVRGIGPATAFKLMEHHGLNVDALKSGLHGTSLRNDTPDDWASSLRSAAALAFAFAVFLLALRSLQTHEGGCSAISLRPRTRASR